MWLTQSAAGGLWFGYLEGGTLVRKWVEVEGEVVESFGQALKEEPPDLFSEHPDQDRDRDENSVLALAAAITGISEEHLFSMPFTVFISTRSKEAPDSGETHG